MGMPSWPFTMWKTSKQAELIKQLQSVYDEIAKDIKVPSGDFPVLSHMQRKLAEIDFTTLSTLDPSKIEAIENMLSVEIPRLVQSISDDGCVTATADVSQARRVLEEYVVVERQAR